MAEVNPVIYTVDIGDSLMRAGVFKNGNCRELISIQTPHANRKMTGEQALFGSLETMLEQIAESQPRMDGLAVSASGIMTLRDMPGTRKYGPFKDHELYVLASNIDGLKYVPLMTRIEQLGFDVPIHIENDCNAAIRSAIELQDGICINIGEGLGAAVKKNGVIQHVPGSWSCYEIGHGMRYNLPEEVTRQCHCGTIGCLEAVVGGWAMAERYRTKPENASPEVYELMRNDVLNYLPVAISEIVMTTGINTVMMSGKGSVGYSQNGYFLAHLKKATEALLAGMEVQFKMMNLGELAELQGVALAFLDHDLLSMNVSDR